MLDAKSPRPSVDSSDSCASECEQSTDFKERLFTMNDRENGLAVAVLTGGASVSAQRWDAACLFSENSMREATKSKKLNGSVVADLCNSNLDAFSTGLQKLADNTAKVAPCLTAVSPIKSVACWMASCLKLSCSDVCK